MGNHIEKNVKQSAFAPEIAAIYENPERHFYQNRRSGLVGEGGFEPPKAVPADLQSVPFGHSGIPPYSVRLFRVSYDGSASLSPGWWSW